jgi:hypothetical protein
MRVFIGLDVSLAKTAICVVDRDGAVPHDWYARLAKPPMEPLRQRTGLESRRDRRSASCPRARSRPIKTTPAALPR